MFDIKKYCEEFMEENGLMIKQLDKINAVKYAVLIAANNGYLARIKEEIERDIELVSKNEGTKSEQMCV